MCRPRVRPCVRVVRPESFRAAGWTHRPCPLLRSCKRPSCWWGRYVRAYVGCCQAHVCKHVHVCSTRICSTLRCPTVSPAATLFRWKYLDGCGLQHACQDPGADGSGASPTIEFSLHSDHDVAIGTKHHMCAARVCCFGGSLYEAPHVSGTCVLLWWFLVVLETCSEAFGQVSILLSSLRCFAR